MLTKKIADAFVKQGKYDFKDVLYFACRVDLEELTINNPHDAMHAIDSICQIRSNLSDHDNIDQITSEYESKLNSYFENLVNNFETMSASIEDMDRLLILMKSRIRKLIDDIDAWKNQASTILLTEYRHEVFNIFRIISSKTSLDHKMEHRLKQELGAYQDTLLEREYFLTKGKTQASQLTIDSQGEKSLFKEALVNLKVACLLIHNKSFRTHLSYQKLLEILRIHSNKGIEHSVGISFAKIISQELYARNSVISTTEESNLRSYLAEIFKRHFKVKPCSLFSDKKYYDQSLEPHGMQSKRTFSKNTAI